jgi:hypothetical protein
MADATAETAPAAAGMIHVEISPERPDISVFRLLGADQDGKEFMCSATFDTVRLVQQIFGPLFQAAAVHLLMVSMGRTDRIHERPLELEELELLAEMPVLAGARLADLQEVQSYIRETSKVATKTFGTVARRLIDAVADNAISVLEGLPQSRPHAEDKSERGSPPHADTASLADGASSSSDVAGGDSPLFERSPGPGELAA